MVGLLAGLDPLLALAGAGGLIFVFIAMADLTLGLCVFVVVGVLEVLPAAGGQFLSLAKLLGLLLALSWLAAVSTGERGGGDLFSKHPALAAALLAFLAWASISLIWAESPGDGLASIVRYAPNAFLFLIVYAAVRERRHALWIAVAFAAGAAVTAAYGLLAPPDQDTSSETLSRVAGTIGDPNEFAALLLTGFVFAVALSAAYGRVPLLRLAALGAATVCVLGILLSLSRGGLIALGFALLAGLLFGGRWRLAVLAVACLLGTVALTYLTFFTTYDERARIVSAERGSGRVDIWTVGWRMVEDQPVLGVGVGNFPTRSIDYVLQPGSLPRDEKIVDERKVAHNTYLGILAELGIVGLALFLAIIGASLYSALRAARSFQQQGDPAMELLARGLVVALIGVLAADFFISQEFSKQLWLLLALGPALLVAARRQRDGEDGHTGLVSDSSPTAT